MHARQTAAVEPAPILGWARRLLRRQLAVLSRLADAVRRQVEAAPSVAGPVTDATVLAVLGGVERALRLRVRAFWAERLIAALRARLAADLQTLDNGRLPDPPAPGAAPGRQRRPEDEAGMSADKIERPEPRERREGESFGLPRSLRDDAFARILERPTVEIIALICRRLGLPADWPRLTEEAWAREQRSRDDGGGLDRPSPAAPGTHGLRIGAQTAVGLILEALSHPPKPAFSSS